MSSVTCFQSWARQGADSYCMIMSDALFPVLDDGRRLYVSDTVGTAGWARIGDASRGEGIE